jgi:hypothetical protein
MNICTCTFLSRNRTMFCLGKQNHQEAQLSPDGAQQWTRGVFPVGLQQCSALQRMTSNNVHSSQVVATEQRLFKTSGQKWAIANIEKTERPLYRILSQGSQDF